LIITISGTPGSGKSTVAKIIMQELGAERIYVGGIRRELAREKSMTLEELNEYAKDNPETDVDIDNKVAGDAKKLESEGKIVLVEGRTQYHFLSNSVKIYIKVNPDVGAERIWKDLENKETQNERNEGNIQSFDEMKVRIRERTENDKRRYHQYYNINPYDESQYDFVVDSTNISATEVAKKVLDFIRSQQSL
jgi:CMP/dCMP kinase